MHVLYLFYLTCVRVGFTSAGFVGDAFTLATAAVLPFYILMVAAPKAELVRAYVLCNLFGCKWFGFDPKSKPQNEPPVCGSILSRLNRMFTLPWCRLKSVWEVAYRMLCSGFYICIFFTSRGLLILSGLCSQANTGYPRYGYMCLRVVIFLKGQFWLIYLATRI